MGDVRLTQAFATIIALQALIIVLMLNIYTCMYARLIFNYGCCQALGDTKK